MAKLTIRDILESKGGRQLTCTTAYDYHTAQACQLAGIDMLVTSGSFIRQRIAGDEVTSGTMRDLLTAIEGVRRGAPDVFLYVALPFGVMSVSDENAIAAASQAMDHGADGIYYSGVPLERIRALAAQRIPVFGHAGMIPWHKTWYGGCRAVGKTAEEAWGVYEEALAMQEAGCVGIELECVPAEVAEAVSKRLRIPVLSMGSGFGCDGQYLFSEDILGAHDGHYPRHAVRYESLLDRSREALGRFVRDVRTDLLRDKQKTIPIPRDEWAAFRARLEVEEE